MDNVLAITFADDQNAYEALTTLKELDDQDQVALTGAAVVMRNEDGSIDIKDEVGDIGYAGAATGGIVGLVIGILGGPLGVLVGGATGVLIGSLFDMDDVDDSESVLSELSHSVRVGHTSLMAEVSEQSPEIVDAAVERLGGTIARRDVYDVEAEIAAAEDAQQAAKRAARKALHEQRRQERKEKIQAKIAELKSKLHIGHPAEASKS
ncbi:MAG: DUF1269 domain-containing protein [Solirubrobacterales bacterium]